MISPADHRQILLNTFLFRGLTPEALEKLCEEIPPVLRIYQKHDPIYQPDTYHRELGILLSGSIHVTKGSLLVSVLNPGDLFGAAALFNNEPLYVSVLEAREKCTILFYSQEAIELMMSMEPVIGHNYIRYLSERIRFLSSKVDALAQDSGQARLSTWLLKRMDPDGYVRNPGSMTDLAHRLGVSRATLYRELERLQDLKILIREEKMIHVLLPEKLKEH